MVSIIIRTYNEEEHLHELLTKISTQTYKNIEVIVVDSGSTDNTIEIASEFDFVNILEIKKEDFTFGYSLNYGIEKSTGEFIVMISAHCIPTDDMWLERIIKPYDDPNVGISYGRQIGVKSTKFSEHQIFKKWFPDKSVPKQLNAFCNNANCSIRREVWLELGGYDEKSPGLEDILLSTKMLNDTNYYLSYVSDSVIYHIHNETWNQIRNRYYREAISYSSFHGNEKFDIFDFIKLCYINIVYDIRILLEGSWIIGDIPPILLFRYNQFLGTYKGFKYTKRNNELRKRFYYPN